MCAVVPLHRRPRVSCHSCDCAVARYTLRLHSHSGSVQPWAAMKIISIYDAHAYIDPTAAVRNIRCAHKIEDRSPRKYFVSRVRGETPHDSESDTDIHIYRIDSTANDYLQASLFHCITRSSNCDCLKRKSFEHLTKVME